MALRVLIEATLVRCRLLHCLSGTKLARTIGHSPIPIVARCHVWLGMLALIGLLMAYADLGLWLPNHVMG
jgi:hypothetical protein